MNKKGHWSGERLETFVTNDAMLEHLHRYAIATAIVNGSIVLDIACGAGYGTNLLAKSAKEITGIDIDENTIINAKNLYTAKNITFKVGSILQIPEPEGKFDVVICFETLEHVKDHEKAIEELKRVLKPDGMIIISTPDKKYYSDIPKYQNPFHLKELYKTEFENLISGQFRYTRYFSQKSFAVSLILEDDEKSIKTFYSGDFNSIEQATTFNPVFIIAIASDHQIPDIHTGIFFHKKNISTLLFEEAEEVKKTKTYKIGKIILYPFRLIRSLFNT